MNTPQNFSGQNLRGRSFKGQDLVKADFSNAKIQGANFTGANLTGSNFTGATAGLQRRQVIILVISSLLMSGMSGVLSAVAGAWIAVFFTPNNIGTYGIVGVFSLIAIAVFFVVTIRKGFLAGLGAVAGAVAGAGAIATAGLGIFVAWRALAGDEKHDFIRIFAVAFAAIGGTSFRGATLTDADFTNATLKSTDFRGANLTRTCWRNAHKLDRARVGDSILTKKAVRELLTTGRGYGNNYLGANLRGAHLAGAILNKAILKEAEISEANFRDAELVGANLTKVQAVGTDFTGAKLTGACLEAWNIDSHTKLEQVDCKYVFLLEHEDANGSRERRPHDMDTVFAPGDFARLYQEVMNTVEILLRNGMNPEAFNLAFQKLMVENPDITPASVQGIQKKGNDVLLTIEVPEGTDKGKIERDFLEPYKFELEAQKNAALLESEKRHNQSLTEITLALIKNPPVIPTINLTNDNKLENKSMNDSTDNSRKIENKDGNVIGNILGDDGTISGTVAHTINQLPDEPESDQPSIKALLSQLQAAFEADPELKPEQKAKALKQIQALAEAGKDIKSGTMKEAADTALTMLKGLITDLPLAAAAVTACKELLPTISSLFGL